MKAISAHSKMRSIQTLNLLSFSLVYYLIGLGSGALLIHSLANFVVSLSFSCIPNLVIV